MNKKRVLLSGIGGFFGSHLLAHILTKTDWEVVGVASWQHKGVPERILDDIHYQENKDRVTIITHDLVAPFSELSMRKMGKIDYILNIASESHVDRSITDPVPFIKNNVDVALNMLEAARILKPEVFIQFSTDEVYGCAPEGVDHAEWSPIIPSNPYSASKAAQEAIAISYWRTYNVPVIITNTMNLMGERQDKEKFIPICIRKILAGEEITIHSYPDKTTPGSRFYIHARNAADGLLFILDNLPAKFFGQADRPDRYNIVGEKEVDNLTLANMIANILDKPLKYILTDFHSSRPGHDSRYALSGEKLAKEGWTPPVSLERSLESMILWTLKPENKKWIQ